MDQFRSSRARRDADFLVDVMPAVKRSLEHRRRYAVAEMADHVRREARAAFAGDLSEQQAGIIGTIQRPVSELAFGEPTGKPAWKTLPSRAVVATGDKAAGTDVVRAQAERAGADITEVAGSHVIMISHPETVVDVIEAAIAKVG
jgi:hypothetical protein